MLWMYQNIPFKAKHIIFNNSFMTEKIWKASVKRSKPVQIDKNLILPKKMHTNISQGSPNKSLN